MGNGSKWILGLTLAALAPLAPAQSAPPSASTQPVVEVWRSPTCGCCGEWVKHLQRNGFATRVHMVEDTSAFRRAAGIPERLGACHTAKVAGYAIEGHVPAQEIRRLLAEKPNAVGLSVPGMPLGSPGMEQGGMKQPYEVLLVAKDGGTSVYRKY
jgi:hypothetical protein